MPRRLEFYCDTCDKRFIRVLTLNEDSKIIKCNDCNCLCEIIWTIANPPKHQIVHGSKPLVIFRDKNGEVSVPPSYNSPTPKGMIREEYSYFDSKKLERELQEKAIVKNKTANLIDDEFTNQNRKIRQDEINSNLSKIIREEGDRIQNSDLKDKSFNPSKAEDLLKSAMKYNKTRRRRRKPINAVPIIMENHK